MVTAPVIAAVSAVMFEIVDYSLPRSLSQGDQVLLRWAIVGIVAYLTAVLLSS